MDVWSKHGTAAKLKIRSNARRLACASVLAAWLLSVLACSRTYVGPADLTATAAARNPYQALPTSTILPPTLPPEQPALDPPPASVTAVATPMPDPATPPPPAADKTANPPILYYTQAGDTIPALAVRYNTRPEEITSPDSFPPKNLLKPGQLLLIPNRVTDTGPTTALLPDSEIVYSPSALSFDTQAFVDEAGGYLTTYRESLSSGTYTGAEIINRVAIENSVNPRLLLALLEYQSHWVYGKPKDMRELDFPIGKIDVQYKGLYKQLSWAVQYISIGYYGWRAGLLTEIKFQDQRQPVRIAPGLNAGSVALQLVFAQVYSSQKWADALYTPNSLPVQYEKMFGSPWTRAQTVEPLYPPNLTQPTLELPFRSGHTWSLTGGPHSAWGPNGALAALDFAPAGIRGCANSLEWVTASASGLVVRAENGSVILDLDGDGYEQTGWAILYMHIANDDRAAVGTWLDVNDRIGHPSCEGGVATGTHVHIARKYNGEWILADGPLPFVLSGWQAHAGSEPYKGTLTHGEQTAEASIYGSYETRVTRFETQP